MTDLHRHPDAGDDASAEPANRPASGTARRTSMIGIILLIVLILLLLAGLHLSGVVGPGGSSMATMQGAEEPIDD